MAGMIPNKKTLHEIELEIEKLRDRHDQSVDNWLKARFGAPSEGDNPSNGQYNCAPSQEAE